MARARSHRYSHESNILNFGHFGTATYDENDHEWHFIREHAIDEAIVSVGVIGNVETLIPASSYESNESANTKDDIKTLTQIGLDTRYLSRELILDRATAFPEHNLEPLAFGSALRLGGDDMQSGHSSVPIVAYTSGDAHDVLQLRCIGKRNIEHEDVHGITQSYRIPSLSDGETCRSNFGSPILQISFSSRKSRLQKDAILAVRQASCTTIVQPLIHLERPRNSSTLEANLLTKIPSSTTGGAAHVHVATHPENSNVLAIVDIEGNWSIWEIRGKRRYDARISYHANLHASGRIFSFSHEKRPEDVGLFHDGWHKICWLSNDNETVNRLLVCNRQTALLFNLEGTLIVELDTRLGSKNKGRWILDVQPVFDDSHFIILTDVNVLLFSASQREWKEASRIESPQLLCAWRHFRNASTKSIKMTVCYGENAAIVILTLGKLELATGYAFQKSITSSKTIVRTSDPLTVHLPSLPDSITMIKPMVLQVSRGSEKWLQAPFLVELFLCGKDQSVRSILLELHSIWNFSIGLWMPLLYLPSKKSSIRKSARFVGEDDDEEQLLFISDSDPESTSHGFYSLENDVNNLALIRKGDNVLDFQIAYSKLLKEISSQNRIQATSILNHVSNELDERLEQQQTSFQSVATLLSTLVPLQTQVLDIEQDSTILRENLQRLIQPDSTRLIDNVEDGNEAKSWTLIQIYHQLLSSFVSSLAPSIPSRIRLKRERIARDMSLQIYLSNFIMWRTTIKVVGSKSAQTSAPDDSIRSEPLLPNEADLVMSTTSFASVDDQITDDLQSPLTNALQNLSRFTRIDIPPVAPLSREISDILAHLPSSPNANPTDYNYQNIELDLALERGREYEAKLDPRARRRADRTARAKQKAMEKQVQLRNTTQMQGLAIPNISTGSQPLVIRNVQSSQVQPTVLSSSQEGERISMTQPEAGVHGGRKEGKKNPRKKRMAGF